MTTAFNVSMRIVSTLLGVAMVAMGAVWILQGFNLAFRVGFMVAESAGRGEARQPDVLAAPWWKVL